MTGIRKRCKQPATTRATQLRETYAIAERALGRPPIAALTGTAESTVKAIRMVLPVHAELIRRGILSARDD
jgi:hypothetical protein